MRSLIIASAVGLALSACTTTSSIDAALQKNLPASCKVADTAHATFLAVSMTGKVSPRTAAKELAAYEGVKIICADPEHVTTATALVTVARAYVVITSALKEAKASN